MWHNVRNIFDANGATNFTAQFAINGQRGVEAVFAMNEFLYVK